MNGLEFESKCKEAIQSCKWREETFGLGLTLCRAECLPCKRCIEIGRCDVIKDLIKKLEKEETDGEQM